MIEKEIPKGWDYKKIFDIAILLNGYAFKSSNYIQKGIRIIRITNVQKGSIVDDEPKYYPSSTYNKLEKYVLKENDLLISLTGNVGRVGIISANLLPAALNQRVGCLRLKDKSTTYIKYLYYYMQQNEFEKDCIQSSKGVAQLNMSTKWLEQYGIPLPPFIEQERIVAKIEELFSELDKGVEELNKIKQQLRVYRQAVLKNAFEGRLTQDNIKDWEKCKLVNIVERIFDGPFGSNLKTLDYTDEGIRVVRLENLKNLWFDDSKKSFVSIEKYQTIKQHTIFPSDLIMSTFVLNEIKVCQMPKNINFAINKADCVCIRIKKDVEKKYILYYLSSKKVHSELSSQVHGATRPRVNTKQIKQIVIPIAPIESQKQIVIEVESRLSVCDKIGQIVDESLQKTESLRQSILKKAFTGKLLPQEEV